VTRSGARLFGAAQAIRQRIGAGRFKIYDAGHEASLAALRDAIGAKDFECAWAEGAALMPQYSTGVPAAAPLQQQELPGLQRVPRICTAATERPSTPWTRC
jgi:hypothetical protein